MSSILRFFIVLIFLAGLAAVAIFGLATFVEPEPGEITVTVPASRLDVN